MARLIIEIDDLTLSKALLESQEQEVSLDVFINETLAAMLAEQKSATNKPLSADEILQNAVKRAKDIPVGEQFTLVDLCVEDWEILSSGDRKRLGKEFRKAVENSKPITAEHIGRTSSNKSLYKRS